MTSSKRLFSGTNIRCVRGGKTLFQNLSFGLNPGDVIHLSAPNGAGKTSLLRIMSGALPMVTGKLEWDGNDFLENGFDVHSARFSFLPADDRSLKSLETALENMQFWARFWGEKQENCVESLEKMQISALKDTPVRYLSAGQKRRLSLARVFIRRAPLWLMDEPLNGLDRPSHDLLMNALSEHCANGGMAVIASHYTIEAPCQGRLQRLGLGAA